MAAKPKEKQNGKTFHVLAVDTAASACSVALVNGNGPVAELNYFHGQTHSKHLAGMVDCLLDMAATALDKVDAFAVDAGPGTFTGLRIGLATIKGLAAATGKPVVGVSSLDVLAHQAGPASGSICCMLDARRGEVYTARYAARGTVIEKTTAEAVLPPQQAVAVNEGPCLYIGSGAVAYRALITEMTDRRARFAEGATNHLRALTVARLGLRELQEKETARAAELVPNYIRRSDAENNRK